MSAVDWGPPARKLTFEQARDEQRHDWATMTMEERLQEAEALTVQAYQMLGMERNEPGAEWTVSRIRRSWR